MTSFKFFLVRAASEDHCFQIHLTLILFKDTNQFNSNWQTYVEYDERHLLLKYDANEAPTYGTTTRIVTVTFAHIIHSSITIISDMHDNVIRIRISYLNYTQSSKVFQLLALYLCESSIQSGKTMGKNKVGV